MKSLFSVCYLVEQIFKKPARLNVEGSVLPCLEHFVVMVMVVKGICMQCILMSLKKLMIGSEGPWREFKSEVKAI